MVDIFLDATCCATEGSTIRVVKSISNALFIGQWFYACKVNEKKRNMQMLLHKKIPASV
jgi:hypothetical protein